MLSATKLKECRLDAKMTVSQLADKIAGATDKKAMATAIKNWETGLMKPIPTRDQITRMASALGVKYHDLAQWKASHRYAPMAPRKVRLVTDLIQGRNVQDALDVLKFANKRAAVYVDKVLRSAIANADEDEAKVDSLFITEARVDEGGVRMGTRRWRPKDRGRAVSFTRLASHIHIAVDLV